ncbi:MAG TPA: S8 family serine peptidase [Pyrinomonadaceae bacterium]|nr:S8 family serine peptidase [Pyrinomonadaceae bacterium]
MQNLVLRPRVAFAILAIASLFVLFLGFAETPNSAQDKPAAPRKARFEHFSRADDITNDIRDRSKEIVRVHFKSIGDRETAARHGRIVQDFGSSALLIKNKNADLGRSGLDLQKVETTINLPGGPKFDPVENAPNETVRPDNGQGTPKRGYYIVQLGGFATDDWLDSLRDAGVEIVQYVPHQAFFVHGEGTAVAKAAGHSRVRWVGEYLPEHKISAEVKEFAARADAEVVAFDVAVFGREDLHGIASSVGGRVISTSRLPNNFFNVLRVELSRSELNRLASIPGVFRIDPFIKPSIEDERSSQIIAGNYSNPTTLNGPGYNPLAQFGADGTNVTVMVSDDGISIPESGGFYITPSNTIDGPLRGAAAGATGGHGHINASIIAGGSPFGVLDAAGYNYGLGVAPKANIVNIPFLVPANTTTDAQAVDDALNTLGRNGVRATISNNSWGSGINNNSYDSLAALYDGLVRDGSLAGTIDPFNIIFSAGNSGPGPGSLTRPKVAKNVISVANSENTRPEPGFGGGASADNMEDLRGSSSRGPAMDGRVKPDITAPGTVITGSRAGSCGSVSSCFDANHAWSTGTSHAAPQVAGAAALFTEYWRNSHSGAYPMPSLIKASIIGSAQEMNGLTTSTSTVPNGNEGWGRINMKYMMNTGVPMKYINEEHTFSSTGENMGFVGTVADATKPVRVTLVWTDPPGTGNPALVNNLDLTVTVGSTVYRGNVFTGGSSASGGSADTLNNVENVFLPAGLAVGTSIMVSVTPTTLNGDGALGNADTTDQHFSLVAYNFTSGPSNVDFDPPADFDGDDRTDMSIFRPANGQWWINQSSTGVTFAAEFGNSADVIAPADFTGDDKADHAFFRPATGDWYVLRSEDFSFFAFPFGTTGDVPVVGDYDNDGKADPAVYRPSNGTWYIQRSGGGIDTRSFGAATDLPVPGDYDGDSRADLAIYRPSDGTWWLNRSGGGVIVYQFGTSADRAVPADYTGDGKVDIAFWRPSNGFWFVLRSEDSSFYAVPFGTGTDLPVPGDYDGDAKADTAVFRPSNATWYIDRTSGGTTIQSFGLSTDAPVPNVFVR